MIKINGVRHVSSRLAKRPDSTVFWEMKLSAQAAAWCMQEVVLFAVCAGCLPFEDVSLAGLYRKISRADYRCPPWFSDGLQDILSKLLQPDPARRSVLRIAVYATCFAECSDCRHLLLMIAVPMLRSWSLPGSKSC